jgi:hypothetical protein
MKPKNERYIQFPLYLIRNIFNNKEKTIGQIITYGIYRYSCSFKYATNNVAQQIIYDYYKGNLSTNLRRKIDFINSDVIGKNEDYNGFTGMGEFSPDDEIIELMECFNNDEDLYFMAIEHYQIHLAYESLNIKGNKNDCLLKGKEIEKLIPKGEPMPMINLSLLFDFRDKEKSEFEITQLCAFIAIKSILGIKNTVKTNKNHIVSRLLGYASVKHLPSEMNEVVKALYIKYSHRYHIDKLLQHLELNWNVITYSNDMRGLYVAMNNKISLDQLALLAESKKQKNRILNLKQKKTDAKNKALLQLSKM